MIRKAHRVFIGLVCVGMIIASTPAWVGCLAPGPDQQDAALEELVRVGIPSITPVGAGASDIFSSAAFKFVLGHIDTAIVGKLADIGFGYVLNLLGYKDPSEQILDKLKEMDTKLDSISDQITALSASVDNLLSALQISTERIITEQYALKLGESVDVITNQYDKLATSFDPSKPGAFTDAGAAAAADFAKAILAPNGYDIDQKLANMHSLMMGNSPGTTGFLDSVTNYLILRAADGEDLYACYQALEGYFGRLLAVESKGLVLMVEALNQSVAVDAADGDLLVGSSQSSAASFLKDRFTPRIEQQVDRFLTCVDRLIVSRADVRTNLAQRVPLFADADKVERIYAQADFFAAQVSAKHPVGIVARVIGEPNNIESALQKATVTCGGQVMAAVPVNGNDINYYEPPWPKSFGGVKKYLEWQWSPVEYFYLYSAWYNFPDGFRQFRTADRIAVLKLHCAVPAGGEWPGGSVSMTHEEAQEVNLGHYDANYKTVPSASQGVAQYGPVLFVIRHAPTFLDFGYRVVQQQGPWDVVTKRDASTLSIEITSTLTCKDLKRGSDVKHVLAVLGGLYIPVFNPSDEDVTLGATWSCCGSFQNGLGPPQIWWRDGTIQASAVLQLGLTGLGGELAQSWSPPVLFGASRKMPAVCQPEPPNVDGWKARAGAWAAIHFMAAVNTGSFPLFGFYDCYRPMSGTLSVQLKSLELVVQ